jgi:uncharacterized membrane protein
MTDHDGLPATDRSTGAAAERERRNEDHDVRRVEAFSDGVFAIAATLLVLDLTVRELGTIGTDGDLLTALLDQSSTIIAFVVSFLLLCLLWWIHTRAFEDVVRVDGPFVALNSLRLLAVVLIPFTTSLSSTYPDLATGALYLAVDFAAVVIVGAIQGWYATDARHGLMPDLGTRERRIIRRGALSAVILSLAAVVLAPILGTLAFAVYALDPLLSRRLEAGVREEASGQP